MSLRPAPSGGTALPDPPEPQPLMHDTPNQGLTVALTLPSLRMPRPPSGLNTPEATVSHNDYVPIFVGRNIRPVFGMHTPDVNGNLHFTVNLQISVFGQTAEAGILWCIRNKISNGPELQCVESRHASMGSAHPRHEEIPPSLELHHRDMSNRKCAGSREVAPLLPRRTS